jgi:hypothetical protein
MYNHEELFMNAFNPLPVSGKTRGEITKKCGLELKNTTFQRKSWYNRGIKRGSLFK